LPGNAVSTFLENFPILSGKLLVVPRVMRAMLSVVDLTLGIGVWGSSPCRVASLAFSLARVQSSSWSPERIHWDWEVELIRCYRNCGIFTVLYLYRVCYG
jgi:hypothetical protein